MTNMVEQVARAIHASLHNDPELWDYQRHLVHEQCMKQARAAIKAMREPSEGMMQAMYEAMFVDKFDGTQLPMLGAGIEAMIDAALSEKP